VGIPVGDLPASAIAEVDAATGAGHRVIALRGRPSIGKLDAARRVADRTGRALLAVDVPSLLRLTSVTPAHAVRLIFREALLLRATVYWSGAEMLWDPSHLVELRTLTSQLASWRSVPCLLGGGADWE